MIEAAEKIVGCCAEMEKNTLDLRDGSVVIGA